MKNVLEFALAVCLAGLVLGIANLVKFANGRLLAGGPILGGRIQPRGSNRFPLVPTKDSECERKRPVVWLWTLIDLFVSVVVLIWLLALRK
jgi:hypothetical protein